jgi:hypothetical protein
MPRINEFLRRFDQKLCFSAPTTHPAETIERLNQKFFGRRVETMVSAPRSQSRVFSKNFMRQLLDGTTQVSGLNATHKTPILQIQ